MTKKKIFITGGHLSPALAVIDKLKKDNRWQIFFVGRKFPLEGDKAISFEYKVIKKLKIPFLELISGRLQRRFTFYTLISLLKIPLGFVQSFYYLFKYKPDVILSFGGYLALPIAILGFLFGIPVITHEQTKSAGLANRIIGFFAKKILLSHPESKKFFPKEKTVLTGNPLRSEIWEKKPAFWQKNIGRPLLYITGGSLGSHKINSLVSEVIKELLEIFFVIHQTGGSKVFQDYEKIMRKRESLPPNLKKRYYLKTFIERDEIGWIFNNADLIISRAGANTVSEIVALGKPAILIPLPFSSEQKENAKMAEQLGLAKVLEDDSLIKRKFFFTIRDFWRKIKKGTIRVKEEAKGVIRKDAPSLIIEEIYGVIRT